jgi:hypothetical protein
MKHDEHTIIFSNEDYLLHCLQMRGLVRHGDLPHGVLPVQRRQKQRFTPASTPPPPPEGDSPEAYVTDILASVGECF